MLCRSDLAFLEHLLLKGKIRELLMYSAIHYRDFEVEDSPVLGQSQ